MNAADLERCRTKIVESWRPDMRCAHSVGRAVPMTKKTARTPALSTISAAARRILNRTRAARAELDALAVDVPPECPGPDCPMCSGAACNLCGARCNHATDEGHESPSNLCI